MTGLVLGAMVIAGIFLLPPRLFFLVYLAFFTAGAAELVRILRFWTPHAPLRILLLAVPATALAFTWGVVDRELAGPATILVVAAGGGVVLGASLTVLWSRTPIAEAPVAIGFLTFVLPYFVLPLVSLYYLHRIDPWLILVFMLIVAADDTAAYFVGSWIGRHKLAPRVSPKKSWEGSIAGWVAAMVTMSLWSLNRFGEIHPAWLLLAAVTAVFAQFGDLLESAIKRAAGVKDSSHVLPGHGGVYDRIDAALLAAPVFLAGFWALGLEALWTNLAEGHT